MDKKQNQPILKFIISIFVLSFLIFYGIDSISYAIQSKGYNECLGTVAQGHSISTGLTNIGKADMIVNNSLTSVLPVDTTFGVCVAPSRIFEKNE